jgi:CubicO group peptidase (beta-lactamase class C family)
VKRLAEPFIKFRNYVIDLMRRWMIPGAAIGVVRNDQIIFAEGFGVRKVGGAETVDGNTIFPIGSTTKPVTASLIAGLVSDGVLAWDDLAISYFPELEMPVADTTNLVTLKDLLCMRSGMPPCPQLWRYELPVEVDEIVVRARHMKPVGNYRKQFVYSDIAFALVGQCAARACNQSFADLLDHRVFKPLNMLSSDALNIQLNKNTNIASPHTRSKGGQLQILPFLRKDNSGGAASINSNLNDLLQWVRMQLGRGEFDGEKVIATEAIEETWKPQIQMPLAKQSPLTKALKINLSSTIKDSFYGLGWMIESCEGHPLVSHRGAVPGVWSNILLIPSINVGIVILANSDARGGSFVRLLGYRLAEAYLGLRIDDWSCKSIDLQSTFLETSRQAVESLKTVSRAFKKISRPLSDYVGQYTNPAVGSAQITLQEGTLSITFGTHVGELQYEKAQDFICKWKHPYLTRFPSKSRFGIDSNNLIVSFELQDTAKFRRGAASTTTSANPDASTLNHP